MRRVVVVRGTAGVERLGPCCDWLIALGRMWRRDGGGCAVHGPDAGGGRVRVVRRLGIVATVSVVASTAVVVANASVASASPSAPILADAPVGYWPLDETSGSTAYDATANGLDGTIVGGVTLGVTGPGGSGTAMRFNGSTGYINLGAPAQLRTDSWTVEAWVRVDNWPTTDAMIYRNRYYGQGLGVGPNGEFSIYSHPEGGMNSPNGYSPGVWHHVAVTKDATNLIMYVDGSVVASKAGSATSYYDGGRVGIGRDANWNGSYLDGALADVAFFDHALAPERVWAHAARTGVDPRTKAGSGLASVGEAEDPVNTFTGSYTEVRTDLEFPSSTHLEWRRFYDSGGVAGAAGWRSSYSDSLRDAGDSVELRMPTGRTVVFAEDGLGGYEQAPEFDGSLSATMSGWQLDFVDGHVDEFDGDGLLVSRSFPDGVSIDLTYTLGVLTEVASSVGPSIAVDWTGAPGLFPAAVDASDGRAVDYTFDLGGYLAGVELPGGVEWTYVSDVAGNVTDVIDPADVTVVENTYDVLGRVVSQMSSMGAETTFDYDIANRSVIVTGQDGPTVLGSPAAVTYTYDPDGRLVSISDPFGEAVSRTYDALDRLIGAESRGGGETTIDRNAAGLPTEVTSPGSGTPTEITYDGSNRVTEVESETGTTTYTYDGAERAPSSVTNELNETTTFDVNDSTLLVDSMTDADGVTVEYRYNALRQLEETEDEYGNITSYTYDGVGRRVSTEMPSGATSTVDYDAAGRVWKETAADGGLTTTTYDAAGRVDTVTDPVGAVTDYDYDAVTGLLEQVTDPMSRVTTYTYNAIGELIETTHPDSSTTETVYGPLGRVESSSDELDRETTYVYDADGNTTRVVDPEGGETETVYDAAGRVTSVTDPMERETTYTYDPDTGLLTSETSAAGTISYGYDDLGRQVTVTDLRGGVTETSYTPGGRVAWVEDPLDRRTTNTYDNAGRLVTVSAPGGLDTAYVYDDDSRVVETTSPGGLVSETSYDEVGRVLTATDPAGVVTTNTWTLRGELETSTKTGEGTIEYSYNPDGTVEWVEDALDNRTLFTYDSRGRLLNREDPNGEDWAAVYNAAGELASETDPLARATACTYDLAGRLESTTDPTGRVVTNTYNAGGDLTGWTAVNGLDSVTASFGYDGVGRQNSATIGGRTWTSAYTAAGDLAARANPDGRTMVFGYDAAGRRIARSNPDGTAYTYAYDTAGRIVSVTPTALVADTFTAANGSALDTSKWANVSSSGGTATIDSNTATLEVPNTAGAVGGMRSTAPSAADGDSTFTYQFASASTPSKLRAYGRYVDASNNYRVELSADSTTGTFFKVVSGTTTAISTFTVPSDANAHSLRFQVDGTNLRVKIWNPTDPEPNTWTATTTDSAVTASGTTRIQLARSTGVANSVTIDDFTHTNPNGAPDAVATYTWDDDNRLTGEDYPGSASRDWTWVDGQLTGYTQTVPGASRTTSLTYDSTGRIATEATSGVTTTYTYDAASQLLSATPSSGTASAWTYDDLGRRATQTIGAVTTTYAYDDASQLTSATPSTGTATSYAYDHAGRRASDTTGANATSYTYDPAGRLTALTLPSGDTQARVLNPDGMIETVTNTVSSTATTWTLDWDPDGLDQLVTLSQGSATTDLVTAGGAPWGVASKGSDHTVLASDVHGSVINSTGAGVPRANSYNAYGAPTGSDTLSPKLGYRGELTLGPLTNLRARDYQPTTGAFTTIDPLNGVNGTTTLSNPYHYTDNNPLNQTDPSGLAPDDSAFGIPISRATVDQVDDYLESVDFNDWRTGGLCGDITYTVAGVLGFSVSGSACILVDNKKYGWSTSSAIGSAAGTPSISASTGEFFSNARSMRSLDGHSICIGGSILLGPDVAVGVAAEACVGTLFAPIPFMPLVPTGTWSIYTGIGAGIAGAEIHGSASYSVTHPVLDRVFGRLPFVGRVDHGCNAANVALRSLRYPFPLICRIDK